MNDLTRDIDLCTLDLKAKARHLVNELRDYKARMKELGRNPVLRLRHPDYLFMRDTARRLTKVETFRDLLLDGYKVESAA